jgi:ubiquinone/menaquinone biosynthesis C-methylase UbiE
VQDRTDTTSKTRAAYDAVADDYAAQFINELDAKPLDRALLGVLIEEAAGATIADVGCGPGHVAAWLAANGAHSIGIDLSARMIALARRTFPGVAYEVGDMRSLPVANSEWGAAAVLYSIIHLEPADLPLALGELRRVLRVNGPLLLAFHCGSEVVHRDEWFGHAVSVDFRLLEVERIESALDGAGFDVEARLERVNYPAEHPTKRAYLLARRRD